MSELNRERNFFDVACFKYWSASILPAAVGAVLPFWLNPPGFIFKLFDAVMFVIATLFCHIGFLLLHNYFNNQYKVKGILLGGLFSIFTAIIIGAILNNNLQLNDNVYEYIFVVFGASVMFIGVLFLFSPNSAIKKLNDMMIVSVGLGMLPLLGAYLIQAGDITRTVYLASLPIVVSTGFWYWLSGFILKQEGKGADESKWGIVFSFQLEINVLPYAFIILIVITFLGAVFLRSALNPLALIGLIFMVFAVRIILLIKKEINNRSGMLKAERLAGVIHFIICLSIIVSSIAAIE